MKVHLIGIGGTGMGALAGLLVEAGHEVRGSDGPLYPPMSTLLAGLRVELYEGYRPQNLDWGPERVVVGNICRADHPEACAARERGLALTSFPALLCELFLAERHAIVVAGTHGKTTTSSLAAHLLHHAGRRPGFLVGGVPVDLGCSSGLGAPPYFVVEGDEYDTAFFDKRPKFVHYRPRTAILTGVELDHTDIYPTMADVERAFALLIELLPEDGRLLVCADSEPAVRLARAARCAVESYGVRGEAPEARRTRSGATKNSLRGNEATWRGELRSVGGRAELAVARDGVPLGSFAFPLCGRHNAENALAVVALAAGLGLDAAEIGAGLASFTGVRRRQELRGVVAGVAVVDDFAHHPTAIRETLAALRGVHGAGRLVAAYEPRSATSRRRVLEEELVAALASADEVALGVPHDQSRIAVEERLDPEAVAAAVRGAGVPARYFPEVEGLALHLARSCRPGDTVLVMSSGSFGGLCAWLLAALAERAG
jgi:UDP-N-acetylmuramate: L-alanyl-gamma-D-glutamyl-meso-diaminopimelate ligase